MITHDRDKVIAAAKECDAFFDVIAFGRSDGTLFSTIELERFYSIAFEAGRKSVDTPVALAATADLDGLILCHAKPVVETLSVVTNTGYVYVRAIDRKVEPNTKLFSAWEPKK